jgi:hypothetical protein
VRLPAVGGVNQLQLTAVRNLQQQQQQQQQQQPALELSAARQA